MSEPHIRCPFISSPPSADRTSIRENRCALLTITGFAIEMLPSFSWRSHGPLKIHSALFSFTMAAWLVGWSQIFRHRLSDRMEVWEYPYDSTETLWLAASLQLAPATASSLVITLVSSFEKLPQGELMIQRSLAERALP